MEKEQFIEAIANSVKRIAPQYGILVNSPIIAQACLESGYGASYKAQYNNFFGLKYRPNRVTCNIGYFSDDSQEQNKDGSYEPIVTDWYSFDSLEKGVEGYFQFININRYENLKGINDPYTYLQILKDDGYATDLNYVEKVWNVIVSNNLSRFDKYQNSIENGGSSMNIQIDENIVLEDKYFIKCPYHMDPIGITIHQTGNTGNSSADNEIAYMISNDNETSFHYAVDENHAVLGLPLDRNGWHAGDGHGLGNLQTIGIEICRDFSDDIDQYNGAIDNAARLVAYLLESYGWDISHVYKHEDWSGKHCPHRLLDEGKWDWFLDKVQSYLDGGDGQIEDSNRSWSRETAEAVTNDIYRGLLHRGYSDGENEAIVHGLEYDMTRIEAFDSIRSSDEYKKKSLIVDCYLVMRGTLPSDEEISGWFNYSEDEIKHGILYSDEFNNKYGI